MTEPTIAAIYLRSAANFHTTYAEQLSRCRAYTAARGWQISEVFRNDGASGTEERAGLQALRAHLQDGCAAIVIVENVGLLSRDVELLGAFCRDCEQAGAAIFTVNGRFDMTSFVG